MVALGVHLGGLGLSSLLWWPSLYLIWKWWELTATMATMCRSLFPPRPSPPPPPHWENDHQGQGITKTDPSGQFGVGDCDLQQTTHSQATIPQDQLTLISRPLKRSLFFTNFQALSWLEQGSIKKTDFPSSLDGKFCNCISVHQRLPTGGHFKRHCLQW